ncbi:MAG: TIGR04168 family protein [Leptolyngbyaceae cyanobacterium bins.302]|nr:TIGR04168 family protein [Leptolyngbyaceae cyanobacterium bins.302]
MAEIASAQTITIAVVGDVHHHWEAEDHEALHRLGVDLVLFVGDLGNEAVDVVRTIAALEIPKAVILGNHDAWYTATEWGRKKCPYDRTLDDRFQQQLDLLGDVHVGYSKLDFPEFGFSVVGARPFSWGGSEWKYTDFYQEYYGVSSFEQSTARIVAAAAQATSETILLLGHCGPLGLGDRPEDPCGKDWQPLGGDHGDPDMAAAIEQIRHLGKRIPLVAFGHMHHSLRHTKQQLRTAIATEPGTLYLNAASVPRIIQEHHQRRRNFSLVRLRQGDIQTASLIWVDQNYMTLSEQVLYAESWSDPLPENSLIQPETKAPAIAD